MDNNISPQEHEATPIDDDVPLQDSEEESGQHKRETWHPSRFDDYVDSDIIVQQLLCLDNDNSELSFPLKEESSFFSVVHSLASTDTILCSLHDDDASDPQTVTNPGVRTRSR